MTYTNKSCAIYWLGDKHARVIVNIIMKSWPSSVIYSFQDFEQEKSVKTNVISLVFVINSKHVHFYSGVLYPLNPLNEYFRFVREVTTPLTPGNRHAFSLVRLARPKAQISPAIKMFKTCIFINQ